MSEGPMECVKGLCREQRENKGITEYVSQQLIGVLARAGNTAATDRAICSEVTHMQCLMFVLWAVSAPSVQRLNTAVLV